jgi:hypothetical protein
VNTIPYIPAAGPRAYTYICMPPPRNPRSVPYSAPIRPGSGPIRPKNPPAARPLSRPHDRPIASEPARHTYDFCSFFWQIRSFFQAIFQPLRAPCAGIFGPREGPEACSGLAKFRTQPAALRTSRGPHSAHFSGPDPTPRRPRSRPAASHFQPAAGWSARPSRPFKSLPSGPDPAQKTAREPPIPASRKYKSAVPVRVHFLTLSTGYRHKRHSYAQENIRF